MTTASVLERYCFFPGSSSTRTSSSVIATPTSGTCTNRRRRPPPTICRKRTSAQDRSRECATRECRARTTAKSRARSSRSGIRASPRPRSRISLARYFVRNNGPRPNRPVPRGSPCGTGRLLLRTGDEAEFRRGRHRRVDRHDPHGVPERAGFAPLAGGLELMPARLVSFDVYHPDRVELGEVIVIGDAPEVEFHLHVLRLQAA